MTALSFWFWFVFSFIAPGKRRFRCLSGRHPSHPQEALEVQDVLARAGHLVFIRVCIAPEVIGELHRLVH